MLHEEALAGHTAAAQTVVGGQASALGQVVDLVPQRNAPGVDRLDRPRRPHEVDVVKPLVVEVVAVRLHHRNALGLLDIMHLVHQANAQLFFRSHTQGFEQGHRGAEDAKRDHAANLLENTSKERRSRAGSSPRRINTRRDCRSVPGQAGR